MRSIMKLFMVLMLLATVAFAGGCANSAKQALEAATGMQWDLTENDFKNDTGVSTPYDWVFVFAVNMSADQASTLSSSFSIDLSVLQKLGFSLPAVQNQVIIAHAATPNKTPGLRYANKILFQDNKIILDGESIQKLGSSVGPSGAGWYAVYYTQESVGFVKGTVKDCNGAVPTGNILVNASDGPFWTYASTSDGSWALPSIDGKAAAVNFDAGQCNGSTTGPVTDTTNNPDPKGTPVAPYTNTPLSDKNKTNIVYVGDIDLSVVSTKPGPPANPAAIYYFDNANDWDHFGAIGDCFNIEQKEYDILFPEGKNTNKNYGLISTGWNNVPGKTTCTISRTFTVPQSVSNIVVSYDFISQEYPHWVNSPYNDIFTVIIQGETEYVVHRTINDTQNIWEDLADGVLGWIATSPDAQYNQWGNGAYKFDGHIKWTGSDGTTGRGGNDSNKLFSRVATYPLPTGATTITVLFTVSDVADAIYDSAAALEYVAFE